MKTAYEIIGEHLEHDGGYTIESIITCMKKYAEEAIDQCLEDADISYGAVDSQSILNVKNKLS